MKKRLTDGAAHFYTVVGTGHRVQVLSFMLFGKMNFCVESCTIITVQSHPSSEIPNISSFTSSGNPSEYSIRSLTPREIERDIQMDSHSMKIFSKTEKLERLDKLDQRTILLLLKRSAENNPIHLVRHVWTMTVTMYLRKNIQHLNRHILTCLY
jgi:hypothetical protein